MFGNITMRLPYAGLLTTTLALAGAGAVSSAHAQTPYDGPWSVVITTLSGACQAGVRLGVQISNGVVVNPTGGAVDVQGRVNLRGAVQVSVRSGNQWAVGSGRLSRVSGGGAWRGQGSSGFCEGSWAAQRSGAAITAQAPGGPIYNYAPGYGARSAVRRPPVAGLRVAGCGARFRSYNPSTGTYLGIDGTRHLCR
jgi:BA14K-like protein